MEGANISDLERRCVDKAQHALQHNGDDMPTLAIVRAVLTEAGVMELLALVIQYRDDLRFPPTNDSKLRRIEAINAAIKKAS
jgi:hypothetical protein